MGVGKCTAYHCLSSLSFFTSPENQKHSPLHNHVECLLGMMYTCVVHQNDAVCPGEQIHTVKKATDEAAVGDSIE